ncbi:MAG: GGDEF domain-containing protein, partial [Eubacterium sp.]|nr:GGDEF domain-containing protein [Candidatus Colimonas fimequi]
DSSNNYHHGPFYMIYTLIYIVCIIAVIASFIAYGTKFKKKNRGSIGLIGVLVAAGVCMQELVNSEWRTCIISLTLAAILQFIHYSEFWQQQSDEDILNQKMLLEKDALTGMMTRYAYNQMLAYYEDSHALQKDHVVVSIDVNGLKSTNDTFGHAAGDELIKGAAECVLKAFSPYGKCFRTGGDEFVAIILADDKKLSGIKGNLEAYMNEWHGELVDHISLACGYVRKTEYPAASLNELLLIADKRMYNAKSSYYRAKGVDRRSQKAAYDALCNSYAKILRVNLTDDSYEIIVADDSELTSNFGFHQSLSGWLRDFAANNQVFSEDKEMFLANTRLDDLRSYFKADNNYRCLRYRRYRAGELTTVLMELVKSDDYSANHENIFLYVKDIGAMD